MSTKRTVDYADTLGRTPINGIIGMTELMLDSDMTRSQRESLLLVHSMARSLLLVIDNNLDISKSKLSVPVGFHRYSMSLLQLKPVV